MLAFFEIGVLKLKKQESNSRPSVGFFQKQNIFFTASPASIK
jgi:hypothetical protein